MKKIENTDSNINEAQDQNTADDMGFYSREESDEQLARLAKAAKKANRKILAELSDAVGESEENIYSADAQAELAEQIAEDLALKALQSEDSENSTDQATAAAATLAETDDAELDAELQAALPQVDKNSKDGNPKVEEMQSCIEALLFMSEKPLPLKKIKEYLGPGFAHKIYMQAIDALKARYQNADSGIELKEIAGGYQLRTKVERAALARQLSKILPHKLSRGAMETLAIIAYKQPVMKDEIDKIRGVDSSHFIRGLLDRKLVTMTGRSELPGRPMLYGTTTEFLEVFSLNDLQSMPPLRELESMIPSSEVSGEDEEDPKIIELRRLVHQMNDQRENMVYNPSEDEKILSDFRDQISAIPISTPYLDQQSAEEKQSKLTELETKKAEAASKLQAELGFDRTEELIESLSDPTALAVQAFENEEIEPSESTDAVEMVSTISAEVSVQTVSSSPISSKSSDALRKAAQLVNSTED